MSTDKASCLVVATMRQVAPMRRGCELGPSHLAMAAKQPTWERGINYPTSSDVSFVSSIRKNAVCPKTANSTTAAMRLEAKRRIE